MSRTTVLPVRRIEVPTPYGVGPVNLYLIEARPLTLVDAGINTAAARRALERGLGETGRSGRSYAVSEIERILITHAHPDHYGLAQSIAEASGAAIHFPERERRRVGNRAMLYETGRLLMEAGMPLELLLKMDEARKKDPRPGIDHERLLSVHEGDVFAFETLERAGEGFELVAHVMPGHTGGHVVYLEASSATLFAGDQLLPATSPNPLLEPDLDNPGERRASLVEYLDSLRRMAALDLRLVYPGHGPPVEDPGGLIRQTLDHHRRRKAEISEHLGRAPKTPYELARELYPDARGPDVFLSVSEVLAHLDLVVEDGAAEVELRNGVAHYSSTS